MNIYYHEWLPDYVDLDNPGMVQAQNVVPAEDGYTPFKNFASASSNALSARCQGAYDAVDAGASSIFAGDASKLYRITSHGGAWSDVSKVGGYTTATSMFWDFTQFGNKVIAVNGGKSTANPPQAWTLGTSALFADLGGSPPNASWVTTCKDFVVMGYTYDATDGEQPTRVRWSGFANEASWAYSAATMADRQDMKTRGGIIQRVMGGPHVTVFQERSISRMFPVADPALIFEVREIFPGLGTPSPLSVVRIGADMAWYSYDGFMRLTDSGELIPIGRGKVDRYFQQQMNDQRLPVVQGCADPVNSMIWWFLDADTTGFIASNMLGYNYKHNKWSQMSLTGTMNNEYPEWAVASRLYDDQYRIHVISGSRKLYSPSASGSLGATLITSERAFGGSRRTFVRQIRPIYKGGGTFTSNTLQVSYRDKMADSATSTANLTFNDDRDSWLSHVDARYMKFSHSFTYSIIDNDRIKGLNLVDAKSTGKR